MFPRDPGKPTIMHLLRCNFKASIVTLTGNYGIYFLLNMPYHSNIYVFSAQLGRIDLHINELNNTNRKLTEFTMVHNMYYPHKSHHFALLRHPHRISFYFQSFLAESS